MLLERSSYSNDFPLTVRILNILEYPIHYHQDIEFVFVLKGEVELKNGSHRYRLKRGDLFTNNGREVHAIYEAGQENTVAIIQISDLFFTHYFPELSKSCYRTYSSGGQDRRLDHIRELLLLVILAYLKQDPDYKQQSIDQISTLIRYLNLNFNLFSFDSRRVVSYHADNPIMAVRLSRIINYLYENHAQKITLQELAEREHLSVFYLSHMIKDCTGMSFREFLCFARIEWSEIDLLETDKRISAIARDVGFSTTTYYEEHFSKWFCCTPEEHRARYAPMVKGTARPEQTTAVPNVTATALARQMLASISAQKSSEPAFCQSRLEVMVHADQPSLGTRRPVFEVTLCLQDYLVWRAGLLAVLEQLFCSGIFLEYSVDDDSALLDQLEALLTAAGYAVLRIPMEKPSEEKNYGFDSVAPLLALLQEALSVEELPKPISIRLRDPGNPQVNLKGASAVFTASCIPKPIWWGCVALSALKGDLISRRANYLIVRQPNPEPTFVIVLFRCGSDILRLCTEGASLPETLDIITHDFSELAMEITLDHLVGNFVISKSIVNNYNSIMGFMEKLGFMRKTGAEINEQAKLFVTPKVDVFTQRAVGQLHLSTLLTGAEMQVITVQRQEETWIYE